MSIFGSANKPTKINQVQINQSVLGYAVPVLMGRGRIQQTILWTDGFYAKKVSADSGKGVFGGKGTEYDYRADVICGLCAGPITGTGDVWSGQSWLANSTTEETYTIEAGTPIYTPTNAAYASADLGVGIATSYGGTYTDAGSSSSTTVAATDLVAFTRVDYGTTPATGEYSVNPDTGAYTFSADDAGKSVTVSYSYTLKKVKQQDVALIPSSLEVRVGGSLTIKGDYGVFYSAAGAANEGVRFVEVSGTPTVAGTYARSGRVYTFSSTDLNEQVTITYAIDNTDNLSTGTSTTLSYTLHEGGLRQAVASLLTTNYPSAALGYSGIAVLVYAPMDLGYGAQVQQNTFEVFTADAWGAGIADCSPVQCIGRVLTDETWGLGAAPVPFPTSAIDNGIGGTWGAPKATGATRTESTATAWFAANGFFISPNVSSQDTAASLMGKWLEAGQCAAFMSEGLMKLVPYGDTSTAGNGMVWVAPQAFAVDLTDDDFLVVDDGEDPVKTSSPQSYLDAYNTVQISWRYPAQQYAPELTQEWDAGARNRYGSRIEDAQTYDFITSLTAAQFAASMRVKRLVYVRNQYEFKLSFRTVVVNALEPMDVVTLTSSSLWASGTLENNNLDMVKVPVRITKMVDNTDGTYDVTAEDYPFGVHQPTVFAKTASSGSSQPDQYAQPGDTQAVIFEATNRLTGYQGNQIWIGACGASADWGSCNILASMDNETYKSIGSISSRARLGELASGFATGADPDTVNSLVMALAESCPALTAGSQADANIGNTLCFVDGEIVAYSTLATTGIDEYTASAYIRRGQMGSPVSAHAAGGLFLRLDEAVFKYTYDPSWAGQMVYLKFQSVNAFGNMAQDVSTLTPVTFTIPGKNPGTVDASSGVVVSTYLPPNAIANVACNASLASTYDAATATARVDIYGPGGAGTSWDYVTGSVTNAYPAGALTGLAASTAGYVVYDRQTGAYLWIVRSAYESTLNDFYLLLGSITTASATSSTSGGSSDGGYVPPRQVIEDELD